MQGKINVILTFIDKLINVGLTDWAYDLVSEQASDCNIEVMISIFLAPRSKQMFFYGRTFISVRQVLP